jgi:hypothetical protein
MNELGLVCIGVLLALACMGAIRWIDHAELRRRRVHADAVLRRHGMSAEQYVASAGELDGELVSALDEFGNTGYIVIDAKGEVVGALSPAIKNKRYLKVVADRCPDDFRARK